MSGDNLPQMIVAQLGARMHYAVPVLLHRAGMLAHFYTDTYVGPGSSWRHLAQLGRLIPEAWRPAELHRLFGRREDSLPPVKVTAFNRFGWQYARGLQHTTDLAARERFFLDQGRRFCQLILQNGSFQGDAVYAFQGAALPLFYRADDLGMKKIYEKFSAPKMIEYQLWSEESELWPGWDSPYPALAAWQPRIAQEQEESQLADIIICGSEFVAQGLQSLGVPPEKIKVVPYGLDTSRYAVNRQSWDGRRPLRLLFVGGVSLRKGVQYIFKALEKLAGLPIDVRLVGPLAIREPYRSHLAEKADLTGQVPRSEVIRHLAWADLFIFPTICDSFGLVQVEALAAGLPVIVTPNAGSVVRDGIDGFIVPIRDSEALAEKIELLARDPELLNWISRNARQRAQDFSWQRYRERLSAEIK